MDTETLLKPRRKVVIDYPNSPFRIGDVLEMITDPVDKWYNNRTGKTHNIEADSFPAIFQPLPWYAERSPDEMPEYVKTKDGQILKVSKWHIDKDLVDYDVWFESKNGHPNGYTVLATTPSTQTEFEEYQTKNKKT